MAMQSLLEGRVIDSLTGQVPRVPVAVHLRDRSDPDLPEVELRRVITADGRFSFSGDPDHAFGRLATTSYLLRLEASAPFYTDAAVDFDLAATGGQPATVTIPVPDQDDAEVRLFTATLPRAGLDLALAPQPVTVRGRVVRSADPTAGVDGATVDVTGGPTETADGDGRFEFVAPLQEVLEITVSATGFDDNVLDHEVAYGQAINEIVVPLRPQ